MTRDTRRHADTRGVESAVSTGVRQLWADPAAAQAQAIDKLAAARVWLLKEKPFFGVLARAWCSSPAWPRGIRSPPTIAALLAAFVLEVKFRPCARVAHGAMHAALGGRCGAGCASARWNAAHDLAIAPLLRDAGLLAGAAPASIAHELGLRDGASADELYLALAEGSRPDEMWCDISDAPGDVAAPPAGTFTRQDDGDEDPGDEKGGSGPGEGDAGGQPGESATGDEPSDEQGDDREDEGDGEDDAAGAPPPAPPEDVVPPVEARARELAWKMRLGAALEEEQASGGRRSERSRRGRGDGARHLEPAHDWSGESCNGSISMLSRTDRSFLRPSRRMSALVGDDGVWPDGWPGRATGAARRRLACVVDTSRRSRRALWPGSSGRCVRWPRRRFDEVRLVQRRQVHHDETVAAAELLFARSAWAAAGNASDRRCDACRRGAPRGGAVHRRLPDRSRGRFPEQAR